MTGTIQIDRKFCVSWSYLKSSVLNHPRSLADLHSELELKCDFWVWESVFDQVPWCAQVQDSVSCNFQGSGNWTLKEASRTSIFNHPLVCPTWLSISPARQCWMWIKIRWAQDRLRMCKDTKIRHLPQIISVVAHRKA